MIDYVTTHSEAGWKKLAFFTIAVFLLTLAEAANAQTTCTVWLVRDNIATTNLYNPMDERPQTETVTFDEGKITTKLSLSNWILGYSDEWDGIFSCTGPHDNICHSRHGDWWSADELARSYQLDVWGNFLTFAAVDQTGHITTLLYRIQSCDGPL